MKLIKIKHVGQIISGSTPDTNIEAYWNGNIPWVTPREMGKLTTPFLKKTERSLTEKGLKSCSAKILPKGSILFTSRAPIGLVAISDIDVATNQGFKSIQVFEDYYPLYIYYILKYYAKRIEILGTGTTFKEISKSNFGEFEIPVPDTFDEQIRIAHLLYKVDVLMEKRKLSINLLWDFAQSTYQHYFNDISGQKVSLLNACLLNPKKSEIKQLPDNTEVSFIPMGYITNRGDFDLSLTKELFQVRDSFTYFREDDVLFAKISPSMENGKGGIAKNLKNSIGFGTTEFHVLRPLENVSTSEWLYHLTMQDSFRKLAEQNMIGSAGQQRVPSSFFSLYETIIPPIKLQEAFSKTISKFEYVKNRLTNSLDKLEILFNSINQLAFSGALDVKNILVKSTELLVIEQTNIPRIEDLNVENALSQKIKINEKNPKISKTKNDKMFWEQVSMEKIANWIKEQYLGYYFNSEMLQRFLLDEHVVFLNYFSSEELKKKPSLNSKNDLKIFLADALNGKSPYLKLTQHFYNVKEDDNRIKFRQKDQDLIDTYDIDEQYGIYFTIEEP